MVDAIIVAARRSAVVPRNGAFGRLQIHDLAAAVIRDLLASAGIQPEQVGELILGNALGGGGNPARLAALAAGLPERVGGLSIDRQCCSGMDAVMLADALIRAGMHEVVIAGGAESYSRRPLRLRTDPDGGSAVPYDQPPFTPWPDRDPDMAVAAQAIADDLCITREAQDDWTCASHARALAARDPMRQREITVINGIADDGFTRRLSPRTCARAPILAGSITAANTAIAADGAAFCLLVSDRIVRQLAIPRWRIVAGASLGADPMLPGLAPVPAIGEALNAASLRPGDLAAVELMEAFAVQAIGCARLANLPLDRINRGGGALARGHPIGASGAINLVRLVHELDGKGDHGLAAIAAAGGLGSAAILERLG